jgi:hypothetical protein
VSRAGNLCTVNYQKRYWTNSLSQTYPLRLRNSKPVGVHMVLLFAEARLDYPLWLWSASKRMSSSCYTSLTSRL